MSITLRPHLPHLSAPPGTSPPAAPAGDQQLARWGGVAGAAGALALVASGLVVGAMELPDASEVETLTDFADIESGRIAEHFLYLGALIGFALHTVVLRRVLDPAHRAGALFGTVIAALGLAAMSASSLLHVSTAPLADLYTDPSTPAGDLPAIEYAWHGTQSIFDTMLTTGVLLVPIGIVFLAVAMQRAPAYGHGFARLCLGLGLIGVLGAVIAVIEPGSMFSALSVVTIALFHLVAGLRTRRIGVDADMA